MKRIVTYIDGSIGTIIDDEAKAKQADETIEDVKERLDRELQEAISDLSHKLKDNTRRHLENIDRILNRMD